MSKKVVVIKKWERGVMYSFAVVIDIAQIILDFFAVGVAVNRAIDIAMGIIVAIYGAIRRLLTIQKGLVLLAFFAGEMIPIVDALPFWTLDIRNLYTGVASSKEQAEASVETESDVGPLNKEAGVRYPAKRPPVLNNNGVRLPRKM